MSKNYYVLHIKGTQSGAHFGLLSEPVKSLPIALGRMGQVEASVADFVALCVVEDSTLVVMPDYTIKEELKPDSANL